MRFVLASHNKGKLAELQEILGELGVEVVLQSDVGLDLEPDETGTTFAENAKIKAQAVMEASGLPAIADDSGLCVDALQAAKARNVDVVLCDTAGRLHNKANLMNELNKISRVIDRECPDSSRETLLVLDATTGQNGLVQAKQFRDTCGITGIVLTKLDGTAKGGIAVAIAQELQVPVKYAGVGEGVDDLKPFDPMAFAEALI